MAATTIGQTGTPLQNPLLGGGDEIVTPTAVVPAGGGTITGFQTQASTCQGLGGHFVQGAYDFQALHPLGNNLYLVLGHTGNHSDPCDGQLHSYSVNIPVQAADVLGVYIVTTWMGALHPGPISYGYQRQPNVGYIISVPNMNPLTYAVDESATLLPPPSPTSKDQCKNGAWRNFGDTFKNQGDCVSFVATHGANPPSTG